MRNLLFSLAFLAGLFNPTSAFAELDETSMYWFKSRMNLCGRAYQIGYVATYARTKFGLPNLRGILLNLAENVGASDAQIEELAKDFDEGRDRSNQEGFVEELELSETGTKITLVLFPMMSLFCDSDSIFVFGLK